MAGARPRTLPAAVVPVLVGTALAAEAGDGVVGAVVWWRAAMALVVALALQVATNYANDYSDGVRGTDEGRVGPLRLVGSGLVEPRAVLSAVAFSFGVAGLAGLALTVAVGPELLIVGAASMLAGWFYTGGSRPYGYAGFGEVFVFVFFGLVATVGTFYVQTGEVTGRSLVAGAGVGALACALLVVNNLRDIPTDGPAGKMTLAVRVGAPATRALYVALVAVAPLTAAVLAVDGGWSLLALASVPVAAVPVAAVVRGADGRDLIAVLVATGRTQLVFGIGLATGIWLGGV